MANYFFTLKLCSVLAILAYICSLNFKTGCVIASLVLFPAISYEPVLHNWCNNGHGMCYPVCVTMHIKRTLAANQRLADVAATGFLSGYLNVPLCPTLYNRK